MLAKPLVSSYNPVHAEWYEDPDAIQPGEYLRLASSPEEIWRAYLRTGARFTVDRHGTLTLELDLLQPGHIHTATSTGSSMKMA